MTTHFLTLELDLHPSIADLQRLILSELQRWGDPLRWAITAVDPDRQKITVEAVVTTPTELLIPAAAVTTL